jgi:hypothetical protein
MKRPREQQSGRQQQSGGPPKFRYPKQRRTLSDPKAEAKAKREEVSRARSLAKQIQVHSRMARSSGDAVAKPSILVDLAEEEFLVKFLNIWDEHVPGFGISKKRERSDKELNMEWRTRLTSRKKKLGLIVDQSTPKNSKQSKSPAGGKSKAGKKASDAESSTPQRSRDSKSAASNGSAKAAAKAAAKARKAEMEKLRLETLARYKKLKQSRNIAAVAKR